MKSHSMKHVIMTDAVLNLCSLHRLVSLIFKIRTALNFIYMYMYDYIINDKALDQLFGHRSTRR